ncbi:HIT family protein [Spirillospora sp. NPDC048911]|uniref:HIT family protein n=1 Tax=Spirillospora sp. NPDC048911 TaxID=3364527 RepID=UPI0037183A1C
MIESSGAPDKASCRHRWRTIRRSAPAALTALPAHVAEAYERQARNGPCFVCAFLAGRPGYAHQTIYEDEETVAFLDRWPTLAGKVLVAPKAHIEHVVRDLNEAAYTRPARWRPACAERSADSDRGAARACRFRAPV